MSKKKEQAIKLLQQETKVTEVSKQTGLTTTRIYQIKKQLEATPTEQLPAEQTQQLPAEKPEDGVDWVEEQLKESMTTILNNLREGRKTDINTVECLLAVADTITGLYGYNKTHTHTGRTGMGAGANAGKDATGADATRSSFVERLGRLSGRTGDTD